MHRWLKCQNQSSKVEFVKKKKKTLKSEHQIDIQVKVERCQKSYNTIGWHISK